MATRQVEVQGRTYTVRDPSTAPQGGQPESTHPAPAAHPITQEGSFAVPSPSGNRTVTLAMLVSFGTFLLAGPQGIVKLARVQRYLVNNPTTADPSLGSSLTGPALKSVTGSHSKGGTPASVLNARSIFGWASLFVFLTVLADFEPTSELAGSFAMLIMLTTLLALGPDALNNLGNLTKVTQ